MRARFIKLLDVLRTGFWFVPSVMTVLAAILALLMVALDQRLDPGTESGLGWAYSGGAQGARSLLSTIAGSMITAASVTFSLASVALSIASQQYGSRVLRNFMRDRITQVLLGTFVATFIYCVLVVRTIRGSDGAPGFVPSIATTVAIALSLVSLLLLIFFIHHVSASIQAANIVDTIGKEMVLSVREIFPSEAGAALSEDAQTDESPLGDYGPILARETGYLQMIDLLSLMKLATERKVVLRLLIRPGDYMVYGRPLAEVHPRSALTDELVRRVARAFVFGPQRTPAQDIRFTFQQLTEVIIRALSPGINDPFTAIYGIDRVSQGLSLLAERAPESPYRKDENGDLRLIAPPIDFDEVATDLFEHITPYGKQDVFVLRRLLHAIAVIADHAQQAADLACLREQRLKIEGLLAQISPAPSAGILHPE